MDRARAETPSEIDLSALAWVHDELRRSLEAAHKGLRRFVKEYQTVYDSDVDAVDPAVLRGVRQQFHQSVGALELVGLPAAAAVLRASESLVQRFVAKPKRITEEVADAIESASFAILDYVGRLLAGKPVPELALFPQYRRVQEVAGVERIHPADLWSQPWRWLDLPADATAAPLATDAAQRLEFEQRLLALMRSGADPARQREAFARLGALCAGLGAGAADSRAATLWKVAAAMFEAQEHELLAPDVFTKRVASRLLPQFRQLERGGGELSEPLARELLFFCAQARAPGAGAAAPRLAAVRQAYGLAQHRPADYQASVLGRFDPALVQQARKRVASAKESWGAVAGGEVHRLAGLAEQFELVGDSLRRLYAGGKQLADELQATVTETQHVAAAPPAPLAMEVATGLLYLEASLEDGDFDGPDQAGRVRRLAERVASVRSGSAPAPLESWMEELYRRVSDRQTLGSVVHELRVSLSESEKLIDQYFRAPADTEPLTPVPAQFSAMRGVLSVLGLEQASQAVLRMRDDVDALLATEVDPARAAQAGTFDRLASNLGALGFLIDMFSVQPQMAKALFAFDAGRGVLEPLMGRPAPKPVEAPQRLLEQAQSVAFASARPDVPVIELVHELAELFSEARAQAQPELEAAVASARMALDAATDDAERSAAREQLSEALVEFVHTHSGVPALEPEVPAAPAAADLAGDSEMREVFLEEAREVMANAREALAALAETPAELEPMTAIRRAFHTLKGSARMVGLRDFGEAAWAGEQVYNTRLAEQRGADAPLLAFTEAALAELEPWVEALAAGGSVALFGAGAIQSAADAMAVPTPTVLPAWSETTTDTRPAAPADSLPLLPPDLPLAHELDLRFDLDQPTPADELPAPLPALAGSEAVPAEAVAEAAPLAFELDLRALDGEPEPAAEPAPALAAETLEPAVDAIELAAADLADAEQEKRVGPLRIGIALFNIFLNEADELSRRLGIELAEWAMELHRPLGENAASLAHSLAGSSATVGFADLSQLARALEHALLRAQERSRGEPDEAALYVEVSDEIRQLLHQFAAGFLKTPRPGLLERLAQAELAGEPAPPDANAAAGTESAVDEIYEPGAEALPESVADEVPEPVVDEIYEPVAEALPEPVVDQLSEPGAEVLPEAVVDELPEPVVDELAEPIAETPSEPVVDELPEPVVDEIVASLEEPILYAPEAEPDLGAEVAAPSAAEGPPSGFGLTDFKSLDELPEPAAEPALQARDEAVADEADDDVIDAVDAVDAELFPIFEEEAQDLLPQLAAQLHDWQRRPADAAAPAAAMRSLHTLKGGARLAGAMRLGEICHRLESRIERLLAAAPPASADLEALQTRADALLAAFEGLRARDAQAVADAAEPAQTMPVPSAEPAAQPLAELPPVAQGAPVAEAAPVAEPVPEQSDEPVPQPEATAQAAEPVVEAVAEHAAAQLAATEIDWSQFDDAAPLFAPAGAAAPLAAAAVRVRAPLLDRMVNGAGEVSITRSRIESEVGQIRTSLADLAENLDRLRQQLRELELQGETQMSSRLEAAKAAAERFDPLEFDRYTRFQELTRMMAESVNDVATVQRTLQRAVDSTEDELAAQTRLTRELQDDLLRTRMVEFESQADRLYRVVRQAAKETGKQVRLDIVGGAIELDRGVLDRMTASFEHLLRNCVTHGIEHAQARVAAGKDATGAIVVALHHERNEVAVEFRDDGAGLDLARIRDKGVAQGLIAADANPSDAELANLIFQPGFSTAAAVTELAGRGVGMDVVRSDVAAMGGRIETATAAGRGTSFKLILPLTTAVTQIVMLRCGDLSVAVPSSLVEVVQRATPEQIERAYASGSYAAGDQALPFYWLGALLQHSGRGGESGRMRPVVVVRSAQQRVALHVDEVLGNQEAVVKNLGPQLSGLPGLVGMTLLASGTVALIYNPVALATLYGDAARVLMRGAGGALSAAPADEPSAAPLVMVVDDSLTVRKVTQRLLLREGYRVVLAKDGLDALERLAEEKPAIVLSDIEMPRMDGFDLVRNLRADANLADLPVIMITSRIAQKHREVAASLGVDHYLGKPYSEEDLLALVGRYCAAARAELPA